MDPETEESLGLSSLSIPRLPLLGDLESNQDSQLQRLLSYR